MVSELMKLLLYRSLRDDGIVAAVTGGASEETLRSAAAGLVEFAAKYGFSGDLRHIYLAWLLATSENAFSLAAERREVEESTLTELAKEDFARLRELFTLSPDDAAFRMLRQYRSPRLAAQDRYALLRERIERLALALAAAQDSGDFYRCMAEFYRARGVGEFALGDCFRVTDTPVGVELKAVHNRESIALSELIGYEQQKARLVENTAAFVAGKAANNVLLYGDAGTGKSTCVKALVQEFSADGLRLIELHKYQLGKLADLMASLKSRNYKFIIFIDDLSFEEHEIEYKYLKAMIEGGIESRGGNILIYATSNRRHLIRETWGDRADMQHDDELHRSDTVEEKTSLAARFGIAINFNAPAVAEYRAIVLGLGRAQLHFAYDEDELIRAAHTWELRHGGRSGRTAQQFIDYLQGKGSVSSAGT